MPLFKVKIYSTPGLIYQGTIRVRTPTPQRIAERMLATVERNTEESGVLKDKKTGKLLMYFIVDYKKETACEHP